MTLRNLSSIERAAIELLAWLDAGRGTTGAYQAAETLRAAIEARRDERCDTCSERHEGDCDPADVARLHDEMNRIMAERNRKLGR